MKCWIEKYYGNKKDTNLKYMIIPATHDSGFWLPDDKQIPLLNDPEAVLEDDSQNSDLKDKFEELGEFLNSKINGNTYTQYYDFQRQLEFGVRLFDFRFILTEEDESNPRWIIRHGPILKDDITIFDILEKANEFLKSKCRQDFIILKIKLEIKTILGLFKDLKKWNVNLFEHLKKKNLSNLFYFNLKGDPVPKYEDVKGKIWIIPDQDFNVKEIKEYYRLDREPKNWKKLTKKGHKINEVGRDEKIKEFTEWKKKVSEENNEEILNYFGFNVAYYSGSKLPLRFLRDMFRDVKGTGKGKILFDEIFEKNSGDLERGVIGLDWATPKRIEKIVEKNNQDN
jgi:hypothetical protein